MSHSHVEDIAYLFSEISNRDNNLLNEESYYYDEEVSESVEDILSCICLSMVHEGYSANAIIGFLADSSEQQIIEKYLNFNENIFHESVVPEEYIEEQLEILNEVIGAALRVGKAFFKGVKYAKGAKGAAPLSRLGSGLKAAGTATERIAKQGIKASAVVRPALSKAVSKVKDVASKAKEALPAVAKGALIAGTGVLAGYGGAKLSGGGGGGVGKPEPSGGAPKPKGGAGYVDVPGKGQRYYSSSDKKYYKNYNDALAARNSRRGTTSAAPSGTGGGGAAAPSGTGGGGGSRSGGGFAKPAPAKPAAKQTGDKAKDMSTWAKANPELAKKVQPSKPSLKSDVEDIKQMQQRSKQRRGAEMGGEEGPGKVDVKSVESDIAAEKERQKKRAEAATKKESYDFYDVVLQYLFDTEQVESVSEAHYVMSEMSEEDINLIVENYQLV
jgi:hypothetical protein